MSQPTHLESVAAAAVARAGLAFSAAQVAANPLIPEAQDGFSHWSFAFVAPSGRRLGGVVSVFYEDGEARAPEADLVMAMLGEDVRLYRETRDLPAFLRAIDAPVSSADGLQPVFEAFREASSGLEDMLDPDTLADLLAATSYGAGVEPDAAPPAGFTN